MPYYCTVPRCTSMAGKAKNVSFHQFPRDEELAKLWNKILKRGKPYTKYSKVCSLHFTPEDYTITSVGKNKGQWRTLRKDAIPSQNLPSESPTPYQRKQWGSWTHNAPTTVLDPSVQQQVAHAIYMQTMLAMQAVGAGELSASNNNGLQLPLPTDAPFAHTSLTADTDILKGKQTNKNENTSYKCIECSKCFKDPDVFVLHKRTHTKNEKNEKENFNINLTLQANPILANLLKTNSENANIFDSNVVSMENLLMTALAANMEGYMRSFTSMIKNEDRTNLAHDRDSVDHDRGDLNHDNGDLDDDRGDLHHDTSHSNHDSDESNHDRNNTNHMPHKLDLSSRGFYVRNNEITSQESSLNCERSLENDRGESNRDTGTMDHDIGSLNRDSGNHDRGLSDGTATLTNGHSLFGDRILELCTNSDMNIRKESKGYQSDITNDDSGNDASNGITNDDSGNDASDGITNDSQGSDGPICDSDLNESVDSSMLVIDEDKV